MNYDFPVSLEDIYLKGGQQIPRMKAVVNKDNKMAVATVSDSYTLIRHKTVMDEAMAYVTQLGRPQTSFHLSKSGAKVVAEFTYADKTIAVRKGDLVGLRVYVENTYNATAKVKVRIGGVVLKCLNGMMMPEDVFALDVVHKGEPTFTFPEPEVVFEKFDASAKKLQQFDKIKLDDEEYSRHFARAVEDGIVAQRAKWNEDGNTAWDLYNDFTYDITHKESSRATYIGKLGRLNRVANWMDNTFFGDRTH